jgi:hypothetical protein
MRFLHRCQLRRRAGTVNMPANRTSPIRLDRAEHRHMIRSGGTDNALTNRRASAGPSTPRPRPLSFVLVSACSNRLGGTGVCWDNAPPNRLVHAQDRVLQPAQLAHQNRGATRRRPWIEERYNRRRRSPLSASHDDPRPVRTPSTNGYPGRLTACPPDGVAPTGATATVS